MHLSKPIYIILFLALPLLGIAQKNTVQHQVAVEIPEVALLGLVAEENNSVQLNLSSPTEAGNAITAAGAENSSIWLNYSSIIKSKNQKRKVVAVVQGELPHGMQLQVEAAEISGNGNGSFGRPNGTVRLSSQPTDVITNIGSCYTGKGLSNGHLLTYKLLYNETDESYAELTNNQATVNIIYTLTDIN